MVVQRQEWMRTDDVVAVDAGEWAVDRIAGELMGRFRGTASARRPESFAAGEVQALKSSVNSGESRDLPARQHLHFAPGRPRRHFSTLHCPLHSIRAWHSVRLDVTNHFCVVRGGIPGNQALNSRKVGSGDPANTNPRAKSCWTFWSGVDLASLHFTQLRILRRSRATPHRGGMR